MDAWIGFFMGAFIALFGIINPFSTASVFITITKGDSKKEKLQMAKRACITATIVLFVFGFGGNLILDFFGITLNAFKVAAGILVSWTALKMIHSEKEHFHNEKQKKAAIQKDDISIIPLAIPMMSGPGAMTTSLVLIGDAVSIFEKLAVVVAIFLVCLITYVILVNSNVIERYLGESGKQVVNKIMGLIVLVIGIQFILNGVGGIL